MSDFIPSKSRGFVMTVFDYDDKVEFLRTFLEEGCEYGNFGFETTKTGRKHLQVFLYFKNPRSISGFNKYINKSVLKGAHIEYAKGDVAQNYVYNIKEGTGFEEFGVKPRQGDRKDISSSRELLLKTGKMRDIVEHTENFQSIRTCEKYLSYKETKRTWKSQITWVHGGAGVGKSRLVRRYCDPDDVWVSSGDLKWWQGYDAHKDVILDDFRGSHCSFSYLLRLLDRYDMQVEVKGGSRQLLARNIWITCNTPPSWCYEVEGERMDQLTRRIDQIVLVTKNGTEVMEQKSGVILCPDFKNEIINFNGFNPDPRNPNTCMEIDE